ncbi:MAG: hypothetical protein AAF483_07330 [Planctomycetota bacterium]
MNKRKQISIIDVFLLSAWVALGTAVWLELGTYTGWAFLTFSVYFLPLVYFEIRFQWPIRRCIGFLIPICSLLLFGFALSASMHHPPFMVRPDWQWPAFQSWDQRAGHAFALCTWQIFWAPIAVLLSWFVSALAGAARSD